MNISPLETIESINKRLIDHFGLFENGEPNFRVVWSEDQREKRFMAYTDEGFALLIPEVREVRKYSYIRDKYILERIVPVPDSASELTTKLSYEPFWTFEDDRGFPVPPKFEMAKLLIDTLIENLWTAGHKAPIQTPEEEQNTAEGIKHRVDVLEEALYGNESKITDSLRLDSAVGYGERKRSDWTH